MLDAAHVAVVVVLLVDSSPVVVLEVVAYILAVRLPAAAGSCLDVEVKDYQLTSKFHRHHYLLEYQGIVTLASNRRWHPTRMFVQWH